ncbi:MAG: ABC transporter transmembrane domain-containing protein [Gammaproteobacteria bacterium]
MPRSRTFADPDDRPRRSIKALRPLRRLAPFIWPYRGTLALALCVLGIAAGVALALPRAVGVLIDTGLSAESMAAIDRHFVVLLALSVALAVFSALRYYLVSWLGERVVTDIRKAVFERVVRLSPAFFEITRSGELLSRLNTDTTVVQSTAGVNISMTLRSAIMLVGALLMMTLTAPGLTGMLLVLMLVVVVPLVVLGRRLRRLSRISQDELAHASGFAGEAFSAVETVQSYTLERTLSERFAGVAEQACRAAVDRWRARALLVMVAVSLVFGAVVIVVWLGTRLTLEGEMSLGELGQFLLYAMVVAGAAAALGEMWGEVQRAAGALERLSELLDTESDVVSPARPVSFPEPARGEVRFEGVGFSYPSRPAQPALSDFNADIRSGETLALIGASGAGKSTLFKLLLRFHDVTAGGVLLDGVDVREAQLQALRSRIALVPQEPVIFADTVRENIRLGRPGAGDEEVLEAARAADAEEFIAKLAGGYDTRLGERGMQLSGGQRQRLAIARAVLKDAPVLLLDEATSALDSDTEARVRRALGRLRAGRTCIIIAHRLATVTDADRIVVMEEGRILNTGNHEELLERDPLYARWVALQSAPSAPVRVNVLKASAG